MAENGTNITRRSLLQWSGSVAAVIAAAGACGGHLTAWKQPEQPLEDLTAESFLPYEGQTMVFSRPVRRGSILSRIVELKLTKVDLHERIAQIEAISPARYPNRARRSFSLLFELKNNEPLGSGLHRLVHGDFAGHRLFLSQISQPRPDGTLLYEAVFG